jgi:8-oxo-dGTP pyrophosphatase MutT (NUDIX family)
MLALYNKQMQYSEPQLTHNEPLHQPITRDRLAHWLTASTAVAASGDKRFADDGETLRLTSLEAVLKPAAVLVLFVNRGDTNSPHILFTKRTAHLTDHAGQISFPGGRVEPYDANAAATALRETVEETGANANAIAIIGALPQYTTGTGYIITPIVAWADAPLTYTPDAAEVDEVFEVPANFLLNSRNHRQETAMYKGRMRDYYAIPHGKRYIWGATAGMLITLTRVAAHAEGWADVAPHLMLADSA